MTYRPAFLGLLMSRLVDQIIRGSAAARSEFGLSAPAHTFSTILALRDRDYSVTELASHTGTTHANVIKVAKLLEKGGWIVRRIDKEDLRRKPLGLTSKGREELLKVERFMQSAMRAYEGMFDEVGADLFGLLLKAQDALDQRSFGDRILEVSRPKR